MNVRVKQVGMETSTSDKSNAEDEKNEFADDSGESC